MSLKASQSYNHNTSKDQDFGSKGSMYRTYQSNNSHKPTTANAPQHPNNKSTVEKNMNPDRLVKEFYSKFLLLYNSLMSKRETIAMITDSSNDYAQQIDDQYVDQQNMLVKLEREKDSLKKLNVDLLSLSPPKDARGASYKRELMEKNELIQSLNGQIKVSLDELSDSILKCDLLQRENIHIDSERSILMNKEEELEEWIRELEKNLMNKEVENRDYQDRIKGLLTNINEIDACLTTAIETECDQEEEMKKNVEAYRDTLKRYNNTSRRKQDDEKIVQKADEALKSKVQRLDVVLQANEKLEKKVKDLERKKEELEELLVRNEAMSDENEQLKSSVAENVNPNIVNNRVFKTVYHNLLKAGKAPYTKNPVSVLNSNNPSRKASKNILSSFQSTLFTSQAEEAKHDGELNHSKSFISSANRPDLKELQRLLKEMNKQGSIIAKLTKHEDETLTQIQQNDNKIKSFNSNLINTEKAVETYVIEKGSLDNEFEEKARHLQQVQTKYDETMRMLPDKLRQTLSEVNDEDAEMPELRSPTKFSDLGDYDAHTNHNHNGRVNSGKRLDTSHKLLTEI